MCMQKKLSKIKDCVKIVLPSSFFYVFRYIIHWEVLIQKQTFATIIIKEQKCTEAKSDNIFYVSEMNHIGFGDD